MLEITVKAGESCSQSRRRKRKAAVGRICKKGGFKSGMKERGGDEKLIIISVAVRGINDHIRFYSQLLCTAAINTSNTTRTDRCRPNATPAVWILIHVVV